MVCAIELYISIFILINQYNFVQLKIFFLQSYDLSHFFTKEAKITKIEIDSNCLI